MFQTTRRRAPAWTLLFASLAAFMTSLDTQVVTTALPTIRARLGGSVGGLEWTMNAYYLPFACLLIPAAGLGDRWGRRRVLILGLGLFGAASLAAALAPDLGALIAARALQGAGAAAVMPLTLTVISEAFPPEGRGRAIGIWGALLGLGGVVGPLVGGALVEWAGWPAIFWVNVPIAVLVSAGLGWAVAESRGPRQSLDVRGLALAATGLLGIAWGLVNSADASWASTSVWLPLAAGVVLLAGFVAVEHTATHPLMPTSLFRSRDFTAANGVCLAIYGSVAGGVYLMSQFFQTVQHTSPVVAALRFAPWPAPAMLLAPLAGAYAARVGTRALFAAGMACHTAALAWFAASVHADTAYGHLVGPLLLSGVGIGLVFPTVSVAVMGSVPPDRMGIASGVNGSLREVGGIAGVAIAATVFAHAGGYATRATFATGFVHAMWACVILSATGAAVAFAATGRRRIASILDGVVEPA